MQVLHGQHQLPDVFLCLPLVEAFLVVDAVHEVAARAQLHHQVVAVLRLQDVQQLCDVGMADHLLDVALPPQVLGHIGVFLGLPLVDHLHRHLERSKQKGILNLDKRKFCQLKFGSNVINTTGRQCLRGGGFKEL